VDVGGRDGHCDTKRETVGRLAGNHSKEWASASRRPLTFYRSR
jgi:hypothetical protein